MATVLIPSSLHARITLIAISPRLAMSTFLNFLISGIYPSVVYGNDLSVSVVVFTSLQLCKQLLAQSDVVRCYFDQLIVCYELERLLK